MPQGKPWKEDTLPPLPSQGALYLTLLSPPSLGNATMVMLLLLSLRWGINTILLGSLSPTQH